MKKVGEGIGYGKIILFGEHFIVYGAPGIAAGVKALLTRLRVKEGTWSEKVDPEIIDGLKAVAKAMGKEKEYEIEVIEHVPYRQNLGSSAALCVAFARALADLYNMDISDEEINAYAYEGERVFHGTPSGIDNTAATYGRVFAFQKTKSGPKIEGIEIATPLHLLIISCGEKKKSTKELVEQVRAYRRFDITETLFSTYQHLYLEVLQALKEGDMGYLGYLMDVNHALLSAFDLSTPEIEQIRAKVKALGALGSKITGAGKGGNIIALFKDEETAKAAKDALSKERTCFYTTVQ